VQRLEIVQVDALRQLLGCACSSGHRSSVAQCHHGVDPSQYQQGNGERHVHQ
jgi:hypothetical protein